MNKTVLLLVFFIITGLVACAYPAKAQDDEDVYYFIFRGVYDETSGILSGACNVTAHFNILSPYVFEVNDSNSPLIQNFSTCPIYFSYDLSPYPREYWTTTGQNNTVLYICNDATEEYTLYFNDLAGKLDNYDLVSVAEILSGSERVVEQRRIDKEGKIGLSVVQGRKYTISISTYTYGEVLFGSVASITLNVKGFEFPETVIYGYRYVRAHAYRDMSSGTITFDYEDLLDFTVSVYFFVYFQTNDTVAYNAMTTLPSWVLTWTGADNQTDYYCVVTINHYTLGTLMYNQVLPALQVSSSWDLSVLGTLPFDSDYLIPAFILLCVAGAFSAVNVVVGLFATTTVAIIEAALGWLPLSSDLLVFVFGLVIVFAITMARRRNF